MVSSCKLNTLLELIVMSERPVFAGACTAFGFKSLFSEIFGPEDFEKIYILKGSGGSGKSYIIEKLAAECAHRGVRHELFGCSLDPASLDGIIIPPRRVCIVDGTWPHNIEPLYLGAVETVVDTAGGLDDDAMRANRDKIISLCRKSNTAFGKSYSYLRAALEIQNNLIDIITENFNFGKSFSAIKRFCEKNFVNGSGFRSTRRFIAVYTADGLYESDAFFERVGRKCLILDKYGCADILLNELAQTAARYEQPTVVSLSPLDAEKINGLYLPELDMAFKAARECPNRNDFYHVFNMSRFVDKNTLKESKYKIRFLKKCFAELTVGAADSLGEAYRAHNELEKIYSANIDFSHNDRIYNKIYNDIFR